MRADASDRGLAPEPLRDETALIARVRGGDVAAFEVLFKHYYAPLWSAALTYVGTPEVAKECVQEVLIWIWDHRTEWRFEGRLANYLYRAVRNSTLNRLRHQRVNERWVRQAAQDLSISGMSQGPEAPDRVVCNDEIASAVARAVAELPERRREAFCLRYQQGLSNNAVAQVMGVSTKCVEVHLAKAIQVLRSQLKHLR